jgi:hypothetical protein
MAGVMWLHVAGPWPKLRGNDDGLPSLRRISSTHGASSIRRIAAATWPDEVAVDRIATMLSAFTARPIVELKQRDKSKIESILAYGTATDCKVSHAC